MIAYLLLLLLVLALLGAGAATASHYGNRSGATLFDVAAVAVLATFSAVRYGVGTDFWAYQAMYVSKVTPGHWSGSWEYSGHDVGYLTLEYAARTFGLSYPAWIAVLAVLTVSMACAGLWLLAREHSPRATLILYVLLSVYAAPMNMQRQGLAIATGLLAVGLFSIGRKVLPVVLALAACSFHYSAVIAAAALIGLIVVSASPSVKMRWSGVGLGLVAIPVAVLVFAPVIGAAADEVATRYSDYLGTSEAGTGTLVGIAFRILALLALFLIFRRAGRMGEPEIFILFSAVLLGVTFMTLGLTSMVLSRMDFYFIPALTLLIPIAARSVRIEGLAPNIVTAVAVPGLWAASFAYFIAYLVSFDNLLPYRVNASVLAPWPGPFTAALIRGIS